MHIWPLPIFYCAVEDAADSPSGSSTSSRTHLSATKNTQRAASTSALASSLMSSATQTSDSAAAPSAQPVPVKTLKGSSRAAAKSSSSQSSRALRVAYCPCYAWLFEHNLAVGSQLHKQSKAHCNKIFFAPVLIAVYAQTSVHPHASPTQSVKEGLYHIRGSA